MHSDYGIRKAAAVAGTVAALARKIGITRSAVHQWPRIPAERVIEVERITGVPREELRPDLYPASRPALSRARPPKAAQEYRPKTAKKRAA